MKSEFTFDTFKMVILLIYIIIKKKKKQQQQPYMPTKMNHKHNQITI